MSKKKNRPQVQHKAQKVSFDSFAAYIIAICVLCTVAVFISSALQNQLTNWDDNVYITENQFIKSWNTGIFTEVINANWAPVYIFWLTIQYHLFGENPAGYHITSLLLHAVNVVLVFLVIYKLSKKQIVAGIAALFFGIHPMHVESVAWMAEQRDLLYTLFYLLAMLTYYKHIEQRKSRQPSYKYIALTLLFFILSALSKAMGETLPAVLVLMDCFYENNWRLDFIISSIKNKIIFFLLSIAFGISAYFALKSGDSLLDEVLGHTFAEQLMFVCYGIVTYFVKFVFPFPSQPLYLYPSESDTGTYPLIFYFSPVIVVLCASLFIWWLSKRNKEKLLNSVLLFGVLFFFINIVLVLQIKTINFIMFAERYTYLSYAGLLFIAANGANTLWEKHKDKYKNEMIGTFAFVAVVFGIASYSYASNWRDNITLWTYAIEKIGDASVEHLEVPYNNRGLAYADQKNFDLAIADYNKAAEMDSHFSYTFNNRGLAYMKVGRTDLALVDFTKAISVDTTSSLAYYNRGLLYAKLGKTDLAISDYTKSISLKPEFPDAYNDRGLAYANIEKWDLAISDYTKAIVLNPQFIFPYYNRGLAYFAQGKWDSAISDFTIEIQLDPDYAGTYYQRGLAYDKKGNSAQAQADFQKARAMGYQP